ncbi:LysR substrate-binding domain-containing protein [Paraburkholderia sp. RL17-337-BIB-A]
MPLQPTRFAAARVRYRRRLVHREPFIVALYEGHPLCEKKTVTLRNLDDERIILYPDAPVHGLAQEVTAAFRGEGVRVCVEQEVEDVVMCIALVASRFGARRRANSWTTSIRFLSL